MKFNRIIIILVFIPFFVFSQEKQAEKKAKIDVSNFFGRIYTGFYYGLDDNIKPKSAFGISTAILGFHHQISERVKATIIYDVTRTTNAIDVSDSLGNFLNVSYFEGSKYTAFLKMAKISWEFTKNFELSVGQLLNQQYLTVQDKWWGFRYVNVTYQEAYRYGMPADFGARITYNHHNILKYSISIVNGDGPFRHQDDNSKFLVSNNFEVNLFKNAIAKIYFDYEPGSENGSAEKTALSAFAGYKTKNLMLGFEYSKVSNYKFVEANNFDGVSIYSSYRILQNTKALTRIDYGNLLENSKNNLYFIFGFEHEPAKNFFVSLNYRYDDRIDSNQIHANFGIKF
ncbi:MAG: hypothetical protein HN704_11750 [Bacteroidetes bacterium]|mgnify:CR=1 FL=1|jgi:hypothetical protein|nr:hypothetical protein [Bacteroidota bacterium]MBT6686666.1 hypothetical protein [Bacteroidota bacterium]MBT7144092.1 hypothetical protein [Bacteroidota bacterium]MBT7492265.1 hypothetical protein [Bacteroidota bacterium]